MPRIVTDHLKNLTHSLIYFIKNELYTKNGETKTLRNFLVDQGSVADLPVLVGFPPSLEGPIKPPVLSLVQVSVPPMQELGFGELAKELEVGYTLFGFAGGFAEESKNLRQRDELLNDLKFLIEETETIPVYGLAPNGELDKSVILNYAEFRNVSARTIPAVGLLPMERWRFAMDFSAAMIRERDA